MGQTANIVESLCMKVIIYLSALRPLSIPTHILYKWGQVGDNPIDKFCSCPRGSMRDKEIRLSDNEKQRLQQYRDTEFDETVPYGFIVNRLIDEVADA